MKINNTTQTFVIALAMMLALAIVPAITFGQNKAEKKPSDLITGEQDDSLVGVWQAVVAPRDCQTGVPEPFTIKALFTFNLGGTMLQDEANPFDGPYRTSGHGIWKHTWGRNYINTFLIYMFDPDRTFIGTTRIKQNIRLSQNSNSMTNDDTVEFYDPNDNLVYSGCADVTATRLKFDAFAF